MKRKRKTKYIPKYTRASKKDSVNCVMKSCEKVFVAVLIAIAVLAVVGSVIALSSSLRELFPEENTTIVSPDKSSNEEELDTPLIDVDIDS